MIPDLKPFPAMKDSGVPWLGKVPEHWRTERAKWLFRKMNRPVRESDEVVTCFRDGTVTLRKNRRVRGFTESLKEIGYQGIRRGDLVIHAMDAFAGAIGVADADGKGTPVYSVCEPRPMVHSHYYAYALREMARSQWIQALAKGIRERSTDFRFEGFGSQPVPVPPLPEQAAIVRFLDYVDRRIRRYIRAKQKLITLLEEQKQAIIHRAVTRGLDPNVRLKPFGVEGVADIPAHWEVRSFTRSAIERADYRGATPTKTDTGVFLVTARNVRRGWIDYEASQEYVDEKDYATIMRRGLPKKGDLLLTMEAPLGHAALVDREDIALAQRVVRFRLDPELVTPQFVIFSVLSPYFQDQLLRRGTGSTALGIKASKLPELQLLIPPLNEQRALLDYINDECRPMDAATARAKSEMELLRAYRTRLLADVVTGKLDVREAAARLPEEFEQSEPSEVVDDESDADEPSDELDTAAEEAAV